MEKKPKKKPKKKKKKLKKKKQTDQLSHDWHATVMGALQMEIYFLARILFFLFSFWDVGEKKFFRKKREKIVSNWLVILTRFHHIA